MKTLHVFSEPLRGNWFLLPGGRRFYPCDPRPEEVTIEDIALSLSRENRWTNFSSRPISVAMHSLIVARFVPDEFKLEALLHDAHEAYGKDLARPFKYAPELDGYRQALSLIDHAIRVRFGLLAEMPEEVRLADDYSLRWEARDLMGPDYGGWEFRTDDLPAETIRLLPHEAAETEFLKSFTHYGGKYAFQS